MIKEYRIKNNLSQMELAKLVGVSYKTIARIESNKILPKVKTFKALVKVLNISDKDIILYLKNPF